MPKEIRYLSKRRINQLITSETDNALKHINVNRERNIIETRTIGCASNNYIDNDNNNDIENKNENDNGNFSSDISDDNLNIGLNNHIFDKETVNIDLNVRNVNINVHPDIRKELQVSKRTLVDDLRSWVIQQSISHTAVNKLIEILRIHGHTLPYDVRTLMQTPKRSTQNIKHVNNGCYIHFDVKNGIKRLLTKYFDTCPDKIEIQINCDGISVCKSTNSQFWPILILICAPINTNPVIVGMHYGLSKPKDANLYLTEFVNEMIDCQKNGIDFNSKNCKIGIQAIICDAPARAFITCTKGHAGYFGCSKCIQEGEYTNSVVFPNGIVL